MLGLKEGNPLDMLRQFAVHWDADLEENLQAAKLLLDNDKGQGTITIYEPFKGLTAWVYNIRFSTDLLIDLEFADDGVYYFGYSIAGHQLQKFPEDKKHIKIRPKQNFIMMSEAGTRSEFIIPGKKDFRCCYLILEPSILGKSDILIRKQLADSLSGMLQDAGPERPYRYLGDIDLNTGHFAETIVDNRRTDLVGRLLTESAISSMLATQMEAQHIDHKSGIANLDLSSVELSKICKIGDYVTAHIKSKVNLPEICKALEMNPKKLQKGVRLLYGCSVASFVQNLRLETSKELIHNTDLNISEICRMVGIGSQSYFPRIFKKRFGILPNDYKSSFSSPDLIFEISYRSIARKDVAEEDVGRMIEMARTNNKKFGITGCLIYHQQVFFQMMEGPKGSILQLYENIKKDSRHFDILTIHQGVKIYRDFGQWDMALLSEKNVLNLSYEGNTKELDLNHLMQDVEGQTLLSKHLWKRVLSKIKVGRLST